MALPSPTAMYRALVERDSRFDGIFFIGVRTTGIFCRPTCPARKPRRENVEFFATARDALAAGYRPCKRCTPLDDARPPAWVRRLTDAVERDPAGRLTDADLRRLSIDPARARRYFKSSYGMTFHAYHRARRMGLALGEIRSGGAVSSVGYGHGFESASGFRETFARVFGRPPGAARDLPCAFARWLETPLGAMIAVGGEDGLSLLEFVDRRSLERELEQVRRRLRAAIVPGSCDALDQAAGEVAEYFAGDRADFDVPLAPIGTPFERQVWERLRTIPFGATTSYARIAEAAGRPGAQRAVGRANGANKLAIVIPCHRVVRSDGSLCGYGGGLWRKRWLLEHERSTMR